MDDYTATKQLLDIANRYNCEILFSSDGYIYFQDTGIDLEMQFPLMQLEDWGSSIEELAKHFNKMAMEKGELRMDKKVRCIDCRHRKPIITGQAIQKSACYSYRWREIPGEPYPHIIRSNPLELIRCDLFERRDDDEQKAGKESLKKEVRNESK